MVVVALDVFNALTGKDGNEFGMQHKVLHFLEAVFFVRQDVDDGSQLVFVEDFVVLLFTSSHNDESLRHSYESIHGRRVAVELVEDDITGIHQLLVFVERHIFHLDDFASVGVLGLHALQGSEHDVCPLVGMATALYADEETDGLSRLPWCLGGDGREVDGKRYELRFSGKMGAIAAIVLIETCDDGIGIISHVEVDGCFLSMQPVADELLVVRLFGALVRTDVEVRVAESFAVEAGFHPIVVHAECTQHDVLVVATDEAVEWFDFISAQVEEDRVDELDYVVIPELGHGAQDVEKIAESVHFP